MNKPEKETTLNLKDLSLNEMEAKLSGGGTLDVEHQDLKMSARAVDEDAYTVVGKRSGQAVIVDGAAGLTNLLRVMEQYSPLEMWVLSEHG